MEKVLFYDEDGKPTEFEIEAKFSIDDTDYVAMIPAGELEPYIYILKIVKDENGDEMLLGIEDDELKEAQEAYEQLIEESNGWC